MTRLALLLVATLLLAALLWTPPASAVASDALPAVADITVEVVDRRFAPEDAAAPQRLDRRLTIAGAGFYGTAFGPFVSFTLPDGSTVEASAVILESDRTIVAYPPAGLRGAVTVTVQNPDRRSASGVATL